MAALFGVIFVCNGRYSETAFSVLLKFAVGGIVAGLFNAFAHELGHLIAGRKNGFVFSSLSVWFFKWSKVKKKIRFDFIMLGEEAGYTEMIPSFKENLGKRLLKMTRGGLIASFIMMLVGIPPLFIEGLSSWGYCLWAVFFPVGAYYFFGNLLPMSSEGIYNDGAVCYGLKKKEDAMCAAVNLLAIQAEMYNGKTPAQIDESLYFNLPQLPEDDLNFIALLNARYNYYLDKEDFKEAKKVSDRLMTLLEFMPKQYKLAVQTDALYNACTFDYDEETADDLMYGLEKYLNGVNTATTVRAKLAYLAGVRRETENFDVFYEKGLKEADRCQIKGVGAFEKKLFDRLKEKFKPND